MFAAALSVIALSQVPCDALLPLELENANVTTLVQVTETHFVAENTSQFPQVVFFGSADIGLSSTVQLAAGERVMFATSRGAMDDLLFEVLSLEPTGWLNTGALEASVLRTSEDGALWITNDSCRSLGWTAEASNLTHAVPRMGLVPDSLRRTPKGATIHAFDSGLPDSYSTAPAHVPVPTPNGEKKEEKPPVVEDKPLPPV